jgi:5'-AMP-activated protein kinase catalytic alpha subunit
MCDCAQVCQRFQVFPEHILEVLRERDPTNQLYVAYRLVLDNRKNAVYGHSIKPEEMEVTSNLFQRPAAPLSGQKLKRPNSAAKRKPNSKPRTPRPAGHPHKRRARWHLGMRSHNSPFEVMQEVYRAMASLNFQWKVVTPYHARCRCWNQVSGSLVKMSLQLYATADSQYLLDFMSLPTSPKDALFAVGTSALKGEDVTEASEPHTLEFFELCAMIISELQK